MPGPPALPVPKSSCGVPRPPYAKRGSGPGPGADGQGPDHAAPGQGAPAPSPGCRERPQGASHLPFTLTWGAGAVHLKPGPSPMPGHTPRSRPCPQGPQGQDRVPLGVPSGQSRSSAAPSPTTLGLGTQSGGQGGSHQHGVTNLRLVPGFLALRVGKPQAVSAALWEQQPCWGRGLLCRPSPHHL